MTTRFFFISLFLLSVTALRGQENKNDYLRKVLRNLETIESASYKKKSESWQPGDTIANTRYSLIREYNNPADTTIGASFIILHVDDTTRIHLGYDGKILADAYPEHKGIMTDDFSFNKHKLPFRLVNPPFFNYAKNIIKYVLETKDSIVTDLKDTGNEYHFKLVINESRQVEFFGKACYIPENPYTFDPTSIYELWIRKSDDLPYKLRREMEHNTSAITCLDVEFNKQSIKDFNLTDYFPKDYEIRKYTGPSNTKSESSLVGKKAPEWTLSDKDGQMLSLGDIKSKVIVINFTGIGCGPCKQAIPFLNELKGQFKAEELEVVAIESWGGQPHSLRVYADRNKMSFCFLQGADAVIDAYLNGSRGVPAYFILDEQRTIRKVMNGYAPERTGKEMIDAITELL